MTTIYRVSSQERLHHSDPLHVGRFYPHVERRHFAKMRDRQDLILYLANIHAAAIKSGKPLGFCRIPMRLMTLRDWVYDYRTVFDHFFEVANLGYNLGDAGSEVSIVTPRKLGELSVSSAKKRAEKLSYVLPPLPEVGEVSKVYVRQENAAQIRAKLLQTGRLDLHAPVEWLLTQHELNFYFNRSGRLQLRDTSTWPIAAIETWPAWLREALFGPGIDIESAYTQFLIGVVRENTDPSTVRLLYPDLVRSLEDKAAWRRELCVDVLGMEYNEDGIAVVKKLCMSLANGSKISATILNGSSSFSDAADIVLRNLSNVNATNLLSIGNRLSRIAAQYVLARKTVCSSMNVHASRKNQKRVFPKYFEWEREARYLIWNAVDRHGIMVHDGIDGIPEVHLRNIDGLVRSLNLRLTRS